MYPACNFGRNLFDSGGTVPRRFSFSRRFFTVQGEFREKGREPQRGARFCYTLDSHLTISYKIVNLCISFSFESIVELWGTSVSE